MLGITTTRRLFVYVWLFWALSLGNHIYPDLFLIDLALIILAGLI